MRANGDGFYDREFNTKKESGIFRIAVLGDSFTEAVHVPLQTTFHKQLERMLNDRAPEGTRFEIYNFGTSGNGTIDNYFRLEKYALKYKPDLLMLMFLDNNDFLNDAHYVADYGYPDPKNIDAYIYKIYSPSRLGRIANYAAAKSRVVDFLRLSYYRLRVLLAKRAAAAGGAFLPVWTNEKENDPARWAMEQKLIGLIEQKAAEQKIPFVLVSFSLETTLLDKTPSPFAGIDEEFKKIIRGDTKYLGLEAYMRERQLREGISPAFECQGHWNATGHRWVAEALDTFLREQKVIPAGNAR